MSEHVPESEPSPSGTSGDAVDPTSIHSELEEARRKLSLAEVERRDAMDREALLRGELLHRVRNMLAIVRSIFGRTVAAGGSLEELPDHFSGRLDALARYQAARGAEPDGDHDVEAIVREELHGFRFGDDGRISIAGEEVRIGHDHAQIFGLAVHELVTNSLKFGVLSTPGDRGILRIGWSVTDAILHFYWEESGVPIVVSAPLRSGFGREFIEHALPYQLGAATRFEIRPGGVYCSIEIPLVSTS